MTLIWVLGLLCLAWGSRAVNAGPVRKTSKIEDNQPQEEVNVLMFGVIQFSESLNYVHETTAANIAKIIQTLKSHEGTLEKLGRQTEQAAEVEKLMKEVIQLLQVRKHRNMQTTDFLCAVEWLYYYKRDNFTIKLPILKAQHAGAEGDRSCMLSIKNPYQIKRLCLTALKRKKLLNRRNKAALC